MLKYKWDSFYKYLPWLLGFLSFIGVCLRFYQITDNKFLFYDEGMYLANNRPFLNLVAHNPPHNLSELGVILGLIGKAALSSPKALWFLILNLRVFITGPESWYFARCVSAFSGLLTVVIVYFWVKRYLKSTGIAIISAVTLLLLPSHVFYSRLGMQEALSSLLFLSAIHLFMYQKRFHWTFFVSAFLLSAVYFTNYRMIIAPIFIVFIEVFSAWVEQRQCDWIKLIAYVGIFYGMVFGIGILDDGINLKVNAAWMFHQAQDAGGKFNFINFFSYPYYVFALEGVVFGSLFWANLYLIKLKAYAKLLPFALVILQMLIFSFAAEKGVRYLCVVLPFMAVAFAIMVEALWEKFIKVRLLLLILVIVALVAMFFLSTALIRSANDYGSAVHMITAHDPEAIIVSTQPIVESLFMSDDKHITACPKDLETLVHLYQEGARYLIVDPQVYISWTKDERRFSPPLIDFLERIVHDVKPIIVFDHINHVLLTRFVLDHNEQIVDSLNFLNQAEGQGYNKIRVYTLASVFDFFKHS